MKRILEKIYVKVNSDFDSTGYMMPRTITWADGRTFKIDEVKDFRPASTLAKGHSGDCYTVVPVLRENRRPVCISGRQMVCRTLCCRIKRIISIYRKVR